MGALVSALFFCQQTADFQYFSLVSETWNAYIRSIGNEGYQEVDLMVKTVKLTLDDWQRQTINHAIALLYERWAKTAPEERGTKDLKDLMVKLTQAGVY
jgi:hypothetical protein